MLTNQDKEQIKSHGLTEEVVESQIKYFVDGFPPSDLKRPALDGDGMLVLDAQSADHAIENYESKKEGKTIVKFVPASGAATRMFKNLFAFLDDNKLGDTSDIGSVAYFIEHLVDFAFYDQLKESFASGGDDLTNALEEKRYADIVACLLKSSGLGYGELPKGLLQFHKYDSISRTPVEEHIEEGCQYAVDADNKVAVHFTVSPEHQKKFEAHVADIKDKYETAHNVKIDISYSQQKPSTDTVAVDMTNSPFRNADGTLLFRPAGHGALLANLDDINADIIFLKNIDNIVPDRLKPETIKFKKAIGGILLDVQAEIFGHLNQLDTGTADLLSVNAFIRQRLGYEAGRELNATEAHEILNRPIRVCGQVKSEGDPGGGPFWVAANGATSLQVVETAQIDLTDEGQKSVFNQATHFNPVDVVCGVINYKGEKFDLMKHRDPLTGFVTQKSKDGKDLKAQELPGLWNGSMADWNTIFVEVPLVTFNPVKSVNDLLKPEHQ